VNAPEILELLLTRLRSGEATALVTIVASRGSIPNAVGAKMLVDAEGRLVAGTVGGGEIERMGQTEGAKAIAEGKSRMISASLTETKAHGIGMMCGGTCDLYIEVHVRPHRVVLFGGGHVNIEVAKLARGLGMPVVVVDDRAEWANETHYPDATVIVGTPTQGAERVEWHENDYLIIATAASDTESLRVARTLPCRYVGLVASKRKTVQILRNLEGEGLDLSDLKTRLRAPVGLDLGGKSPEAVALSIVAEIQAHRNGRDGRPLSFVERTIQRTVNPETASTP
jgi:xanthine dehydrogenase accessory factor